MIKLTITLINKQKKAYDWASEITNCIVQDKIQARKTLDLFRGIYGAMMNLMMLYCTPGSNPYQQDFK